MDPVKEVETQNVIQIFENYATTTTTTV